MFERFTEQGIKVIMLGQEEARRLGHNFLGTEQILLGLIGQGVGIGAKALKVHGVDLKSARIKVEKIIGRGSGYVAIEIPFTPRAKKVLELSWDEARQLGHNYIGTEHLLLGLVREGEGVSARVLENMGVELPKIRQTVVRLLGECAKPESSTSNPEMLTEDEHKLIDDIGRLASRYSKMANKYAIETGGAVLEHDLYEWTHHIHALQNAILANAAARAYPDKYRLGGVFIKKEVKDDNKDKS